MVAGANRSYRYKLAKKKGTQVSLGRTRLQVIEIACTIIHGPRSASDVLRLLKKFSLLGSKNRLACIRFISGTWDLDR